MGLYPSILDSCLAQLPDGYCNGDQDDAEVDLGSIVIVEPATGVVNI